MINPTDPVVTETLLHDHGLLGSQDLQGWQEVHQVLYCVGLYFMDLLIYINLVGTIVPKYWKHLFPFLPLPEV